MKNTTTTETTTADELTIVDDELEFATGAARYLRKAGLHDDAIAASLVDQLGLDLTDARQITLTI